MPSLAHPREGGRDELETAEEWLGLGRRIALATVVETWGSAPRPVGSLLVVDGDGNFEGSVSGGCVEGAVIIEAAEAMADGRTRLVRFDIADETAWKVGLSCGGRIAVLVRPMGSPESDAKLVADLNAARRRREPAALLTDVGSGALDLVLAARPDADGLAILADKRSGLVETGERRVMVAAYPPAPRLVVIGAVHIAQALAPMATLAGFEVIVVDPRPAFASPERMPGVTLHATWPEVALPTVGLDRFTALAVLSHEPRIDDPAIEAALSAEAFYVGALGSRRTHASRLERLGARGWSSETLGRIRAPIGLAIGAKSPAEIAVAILAEIIAAKAQQPGVLGAVA